MTEFDVIAAGHLCLDITPAFPDYLKPSITEIFKPGKLLNVGTAKINLGGPVANTGLAMRKFGLRLAIVAGVGDDLFGQAAVTLVRQLGAESAIHVSPGETTSYTVVMSPPGVDRMYLHCPGKNDTFRSADIDSAILSRARLFHLGYPPLMRALYADDGRELVAIFRRAKAAGLTTSLDMSLPDPDSPSGQVNWRLILERLLPFVDIFLPSIEELFFMLDRDGYGNLRARFPDDDLVDHVPVEVYRRLGRQAIAMGCGICLVKASHRGNYLCSADSDRWERFGAAARPQPDAWRRRELWAPAYHVPRIASAAGSGDSSIAGFLTAFLRGLPPARAMQLANAAGAFNLRELDTLSGLPDWSAMEAFIDGAPPTNDPRLDAAQFMRELDSPCYRPVS
ncbi:MAG TPA: PfkB family carbohydrate kinase [Candidatus Hydrogenedentes bacterium]|nr:PfkB family carbohydrate kinase [Candidatus Hydrogenedentota bacterium]HOR29253.1 PfkB family carbohydrate kinase [Candidatus Sumerlaeota bacterium]